MKRGEDTEKRILDVMSPTEWMSLTQIGLGMGYERGKASGYVNDVVKRLLKKGKIEMSLVRGYRLKKDVKDKAA